MPEIFSFILFMFFLISFIANGILSTGTEQWAVTFSFNEESLVPENIDGETNVSIIHTFLSKFIYIGTLFV